MKNIKYTTDGKKVKVIGQLNSKQIIVREIFIDDETEIPAGEDFIVTTLLDAPILSWKEKKLKEIDETYDKKKNEYEVRVKKLKKEYSDLITKLEEKNKFIRGYIKSENTKKVFDFVDDVLNGRIKYMVNDSFYKIEILTYDEFIASYGGIKLLTILGSDNGNMETRLNYYSDGSGGGSKYHFFKTKEDAYNYIKERIENTERLTQTIIENAKLYNAKIKPELLKEWKTKQLETLKKEKERAEKSLNSYKNMIKLVKRL